MPTLQNSWHWKKSEKEKEDSKLTDYVKNKGGNQLEIIISFLSHMTISQWIITIVSLVILRFIFKLGKSILRTLSTIAFIVFMATRIISYANDFKEISDTATKVMNSYPVVEAKEILEDKYGKLVSISEENGETIVKVLGREVKTSK